MINLYPSKKCDSGAFIISKHPLLFLLAVSLLLLSVQSYSQTTTTYENPYYKFRLINGSSFDFAGSLKTRYVVNVNLFNANIDDTNWGINAGVIRLGYNLQDTVQTYKFQNVKSNVLDEATVGTQYTRQYNKTTSKRNNTTWSFYVQPLYYLTGDHSNIYFHSHIELLANQIEVENTVENLARQTATVTSADEGTLRLDVAPESNTFKKTVLNGYLGAGLTFDLLPSSQSSFFFQPTLGMTNNYPNRTFMNRTDKRWNPFYLIRSYYGYRITKEPKSSQIVIGTDVRGILNGFDPQYAVYLGLNLNVDSILGLFTGQSQ